MKVSTIKKVTGEGTRQGGKGLIKEGNKNSEDGGEDRQVEGIGKDRGKDKTGGEEYRD
jgi:hypothetical protein